MEQQERVSGTKDVLRGVAKKPVAHLRADVVQRHQHDALGRGARVLAEGLRLGGGDGGGHAGSRRARRGVKKSLAGPRGGWRRRFVPPKTNARIFWAQDPAKSLPLPQHPKPRATPRRAHGFACRGRRSLNGRRRCTSARLASGPHGRTSARAERTRSPAGRLREARHAFSRPSPRSPPIGGWDQPRPAGRAEASRDILANARPRPSRARRRRRVPVPVPVPVPATGACAPPG